MITQWDWADPKAYLHDVVSTDRRKPTVNANGPVYGALELSADYIPVLDPVRHIAEQGAAHARAIPTRRSPPARIRARRRRTGATSRSGRARPTSTTRCSTRRAACGSRRRCGRPTIPAVCKAGSSHPSAKLFPVEPRRAAPRRVRSEDEEADAHRHLLLHAPPHVRRGREQHAVDERRRAGRRLAEHEDVRRDRRRGEVAGVDGARRRRERQRQARRVHGAEPAGRSRRRTGASTRASTPWRRRPTARCGDRRSASRAASYGSMPGANPPETALAEYYEPPFDNPKAPVQGFSPRGADIDRNGVAWIALASGHMASFDRRKCKGPLNGPTATGQHCPEGWTLYTEPLPQMKGVTDERKRRGELLHVGGSVRHARTRQEHADQHRQRVGSAARAQGRPVRRPARAVSDWASTRSGWTGASTIRAAGWKGRGIWTTISTRTPFHMETRQGDDEQGDEVPAATGSAGAVSGPRAHAREVVACRGASGRGTRKTRNGSTALAAIQMRGRRASGCSSEMILIAP